MAQKRKPQTSGGQPKRGRGRPTSYNPEYAKQAEEFCIKEGATYDEIAQHLGVSRTTVFNWASQFPEFMNALKAGKDVADDRVEHSLYRRAVGYTLTSEKIFQYGGKIIRAKFVEHIPPDPTSMIFWLKNRRREEWRERHELTPPEGGLAVKIVGGLPDANE